MQSPPRTPALSDILTPASSLSGYVATDSLHTEEQAYLEKIASDFYTYYGAEVQPVAVTLQSTRKSLLSFSSTIEAKVWHKPLPNAYPLSQWHRPERPVLCAQPVSDRGWVVLPDGRRLPERGLGPILAVGHFLNDLDILGSRGEHCLLLERKDGGKSFIQFIKTHHAQAFSTQAGDIQRIQVALRDTPDNPNFLTIDTLPEDTRQAFLATLTRIVQTPDGVLESFFRRKGSERLITQGKRPIESYVQQLRERREQLKRAYELHPSPSPDLGIDALQSLYFYLPPRVQIAQGPPQPWPDVWHAFLAHPSQRVLLLQGDSGAGKSLTLLALKKALLESRQAHVLHLDLKRFTRETAKTCVAQGLEDAQEGGADTWRGRKCILLLDGYDEITGGQAGNLYDANGLADWIDLKVLITCRTQFLQNGYEENFRPNRDPHGLLDCKLTPFSPEQIQAYLINFTQQHRGNPHYPPLEEYQQQFKTLPGLTELLQTPLLLRIACEAFPQLRGLRVINRATLYHAFLQQWFQNQLRRLENSPALSYLEQPDRAFLAFSKRLALRMAELNTVDILYSPNDPQSRAWTPFFDDRQPALRLAREGCPLKYSGGHYSFVHKSFLDYFTARGIWDALQTIPHDRPDRLWKQGLKPHFILRDPAVLSFLHDLAPEDPDLTRLVTWITRTREDRSDLAAHASACAATVLNALQRGFGRYDFEGTRLPRADLRGAYLHRARLQDADLSHTRLQGANLVEAQLQGSHWQGATLGQQPWIQMKEGIVDIAYHPTQPWLAISQKKTIVLWDWRTGRPRGQPLTGHTDSVRCLAFSPDGRTLASGSSDDTLRLWDAATGQPRGQPLTGHTNGVNCLAFFPDGRTLASGSSDNTLRLWDPATGQPRGQPLTGHTDSVTCLAFSPDGRTLASGSSDNTLRLWDPATGQPRGQPLTGHTSYVHCLAFSPDGQTLASGSWDNTLRLWDPATGQPRGQPLTGHTNGVNCLAFSPDGQTLASGSHDDTLRLWDPATGQPRGQPLTGHTDSVNCLAFSPDGRTLASGSRDHTLRLWDPATGQPRGQPLTGHTDSVTCLAFSPDGRTLASVSSDHTLRLWDPATGQPRGQPLTGHTREVTCLAFSPDGRTLASGSDDHTLRLWDPGTGQPRGQPLTGHTNSVTCLAFSPDGRTLASGNHDHTLRLWDPATGQPRGQPLTGHTREVTCLAFSPDGLTLASGSGDKTLRLWDAATGQPRGQPLTGHTREVTCLAFSPDGLTLASGSGDKTLRLWDAATGQPRGQPLTGHTDSVTCLAFSPDGRTLASGSRDQTLRLWDLRSGSAQPRGQPITGHTDSVTCLAFSPDGQTLASGSDDQTLRLWDPLTGRCRQIVPLSIHSLCFSPQGDLAVGRDDGAIDFFFPQGEGDEIRYLFSHSTGPHAALFFQGARLERARGLSPQRHRLMQQLNAEGEPAPLRPSGFIDPHERQPISLRRQLKLAEAIDRNDLASARTLLQNRTLQDDLNQDLEDTPLHLAVKKNALPMVTLLLEHGAELYRLDNGYFSPLYEASIRPECLEVLLYLLRHRPRFKRARLRAMLWEASETYSGRFEDRQRDTPLLNHTVGLLTGESSILRTKVRERQRYLAHLQSMRGGQAQELEGMFPNDFLSLRMLHYLQLWLDLCKTAEPNLPPGLDKEALLSRLEQEIALLCDTFKWNEVTQIAQYHPQRDKVTQAIVENSLQQLSALADGEEILYQTGYQGGNFGHCIYVAFARRGDKWLVRVDNLWGGDVQGRHREDGVSRTTQQPRVYPYLVRVLPLNQLASLQDYLKAIFTAKEEGPRSALDKLYPRSSDNQLELLKRYDLPAMQIQLVGNCVVRSYSVGMRCRMSRAEYDYLMAAESQLLLRYHQEALPAAPLASPPRAAGVLLRGQTDFYRFFSGPPARLDALKKAQFHFYFDKKAAVNSVHYFYLDFEPDIQRLVNEQHFDNQGKNLLPYLRTVLARYPRAIQSVRVLTAMGKVFDVRGILVDLPEFPGDWVLNHLLDWIRWAFDQRVVVRKINPQKE